MSDGIEMDNEVYLDHHTISRPIPEVIECLNHFYLHNWGSLAAPHQKGLQLYEKVDDALASIYAILGISADNSFALTSGGVSGVFQILVDFYVKEIYSSRANQILVPITAEASLILPINRLAEIGSVATPLGVDEAGRISIEMLDDLITERTSLLSCSWANGLTGVIEPIDQIIDICRNKGVKVHLDVTHMVSSRSIGFEEMGVDLLTLDGDRMNTPSGIGGAVLRRKVQSSHLPVAFLCGLARALEFHREKRDRFAVEVAQLRNFFEEQLSSAFPDAIVLFDQFERVPHISVISFPGIMSEALLYTLHKAAVYATIGGGSYQKLSRVLQHSGIKKEWALSAISFALFHDTTRSDINIALERIVSCVKKLKKLAP